MRHVRAYVNWRSEERWRSVSVRVAPSSGTPAPPDSAHQSLQVLELAAAQCVSAMACCRTTGSLAVAAGTRVAIYRLIAKLHQPSQLPYYDYQPCVTLQFDFSVVCVRVCECVVAACGPQSLRLCQLVLSDPPPPAATPSPTPSSSPCVHSVAAKCQILTCSACRNSTKPVIWNTDTGRPSSDNQDACLYHQPIHLPTYAQPLQHPLTPRQLQWPRLVDTASPPQAPSGHDDIHHHHHHHSHVSTNNSSRSSSTTTTATTTTAAAAAAVTPANPVYRVNCWFYWKQPPSPATAPPAPPAPPSGDVTTLLSAPLTLTPYYRNSDGASGVGCTNQLQSVEFARLEALSLFFSDTSTAHSYLFRLQQPTSAAAAAAEAVTTSAAAAASTTTAAAAAAAEAVTTPAAAAASPTAAAAAAPPTVAAAASTTTAAATEAVTTPAAAAASTTTAAVTTSAAAVTTSAAAVTTSAAAVTTSAAAATTSAAAATTSAAAAAASAGGAAEATKEAAIECVTQLNRGASSSTGSGSSADRAQQQQFGNTGEDCGNHGGRGGGGGGGSVGRGGGGGGGVCYHAIDCVRAECVGSWPYRQDGVVAVVKQPNTLITVTQSQLVCYSVCDASPLLDTYPHSPARLIRQLRSCPATADSAAAPPADCDQLASCVWPCYLPLAAGNVQQACVCVCVTASRLVTALLPAKPSGLATLRSLKLPDRATLCTQLRSVAKAAAKATTTTTTVTTATVAKTTTATTVAKKLSSSAAAVVVKATKSAITTATTPAAAAATLAAAGGKTTTATTSTSALSSMAYRALLLAHYLTECALHWSEQVGGRECVEAEPLGAQTTPTVQPVDWLRLRATLRSDIGHYLLEHSTSEADLAACYGWLVASGESLYNTFNVYRRMFDDHVRRADPAHIHADHAHHHTDPAHIHTDHAHLHADPAHHHANHAHYQHVTTHRLISYMLTVLRAPACADTLAVVQPLTRQHWDKLLMWLTTGGLTMSALVEVLLSPVVALLRPDFSRQPPLLALLQALQPQHTELESGQSDECRSGSAANREEQQQEQQRRLPSQQQQQTKVCENERTVQLELCGDIGAQAPNRAQYEPACHQFSHSQARLCLAAATLMTSHSGAAELLARAVLPASVIATLEARLLLLEVEVEEAQKEESNVFVAEQPSDTEYGYSSKTPPPPTAAAAATTTAATTTPPPPAAAATTTTAATTPPPAAAAATATAQLSCLSVALCVHHARPLAARLASLCVSRALSLCDTLSAIVTAAQHAEGVAGDSQLSRGIRELLSNLLELYYQQLSPLEHLHYQPFGITLLIRAYLATLTEAASLSSSSRQPGPYTTVSSAAKCAEANDASCKRAAAATVGDKTAADGDDAAGECCHGNSERYEQWLQRRQLFGARARWLDELAPFGPVLDSAAAAAAALLKDPANAHLVDLYFLQNLLQSGLASEQDKQHIRRQVSELPGLSGGESLLVLCSPPDDAVQLLVDTYPAAVVAYCQSACVTIQSWQRVLARLADLYLERVMCAAEDADHTRRVLCGALEAVAVAAADDDNVTPAILRALLPWQLAPMSADIASLCQQAVTRCSRLKLARTVRHECIAYLLDLLKC